MPPAVVQRREALAILEQRDAQGDGHYHHFGDKDGLERALIQRGLAEFMQRERTPPDTAGPLEQLRFGWDIALEFALKRPALHALFAQHARNEPALMAEAYALMHARVQRLVDMRRFRGPVDPAARAAVVSRAGTARACMAHMARMHELN